MKTDTTIGWVLYDDTCGFCREWIPFLGADFAQARPGHCAAAGAVGGRALGLPPDELVHDIRLLFVDGRHLAGAEVYRYAVQHIWWAYPLYVFSVTPGLRRLWDWGYRKFRDNRHQFSTACGLPSPEVDT